MNAFGESLHPIGNPPAQLRFVARHCLFKRANLMIQENVVFGERGGVFDTVEHWVFASRIMELLLDAHVFRFDREQLDINEYARPAHAHVTPEGHDEELVQRHSSRQRGIGTTFPQNWNLVQGWRNEAEPDIAGKSKARPEATICNIIQEILEVTAQRLLPSGYLPN